MKYNKDYSGKTAKEWLAEKKWTGFLMCVPIGNAKGYLCENANELNCIRSTAAIMNNDPDCDRRFYVSADFETKVVTVQASLKNGNA